MRFSPGSADRLPYDYLPRFRLAPVAVVLATIPTASFAAEPPADIPPAVVPAASPKTPVASQDARTGTLVDTGPAVDPIIPDAEFNAAIPKLDPANDVELSRPLESIEEFERKLKTDESGMPPAPTTSSGSPVPLTGAIAPVNDPELLKPLPPVSDLKVEDIQFSQQASDTRPVEVRYSFALNGLSQADAETDSGLIDEFNRLSVMREGGGKAANQAQLASRASEDVALLRKILAAHGWYDPAITSSIDVSAEGAPLQATINVIPGKRYRFGSIAVLADATVPPDLIADTLARRPHALRVGDPVIAEDVIAAEAQVSLELGYNGYPFAEVGQRDVLLDQDEGLAAYSLPVTVGPRARFGGIASVGKEAFGADHIGVLARFKRGEIYDSRKVDDLRQALIATGLLSSAAVEAKATGERAPDGTEYVTMEVTQAAGPPRVIAGTVGYNTGEGFRAEGSWTHRNISRPEGALIISGVAGTQEQGASATFRRANAGQRDRTFELGVDLRHFDYAAYSAYTGRVGVRWSYDSTPLWQKRLTYAFGGQILGTNENVFDAQSGQRRRRTYAVGGLIGQVGFDTTKSLLDPTSGFRLTALIEPEASLQGRLAGYARMRLDGSAYYPVGDALTIAARARVGTIQGAKRDTIAPSRRFYAGGGGSVRGYSYHALGPRDLQGDPIGGRSINEASLEGRYRFGDYGIVAFADVGQVYAGSLPRFNDLRVGVGLGARMYTQFGPLRIDVATPLKRRKGESRINVYVSIGQSF